MKPQWGSCHQTLTQSPYCHHLERHQEGNKYLENVKAIRSINQVWVGEPWALLTKSLMGCVTSRLFLFSLKESAKMSGLALTELVYVVYFTTALGQFRLCFFITLFLGECMISFANCCWLCHPSGGKTSTQLTSLWQVELAAVSGYPGYMLPPSCFDYGSTGGLFLHSAPLKQEWQ